MNRGEGPPGPPVGIPGRDIIEAGSRPPPGDFEYVLAIARAVSDIQVAALCRALPEDIDRGWRREGCQASPHPHLPGHLAPALQYKLRKGRRGVQMAEARSKRAKGYTSNVEFSAEDASRSNWEFLARMCELAIAAGASTVNIPDTVGYAQPAEFAELIAYLLAPVPNADKAVFSVHCHNALGLGCQHPGRVKAGARRPRSRSRASASARARRPGRGGHGPAHPRANTSWPRGEDRAALSHLPAAPRIIGHPSRPTGGDRGERLCPRVGIHQAGVLKDRRTYEIMTPESIGRSGTELVLGKHSGRAAVGAKVAELGYKITDEQVTRVADAVKTLADKKQKIYDEDVEALVLEVVFRIPDKYRLKYVSIQSGNINIPPTAVVVMEVDGEERKLALFCGEWDRLTACVSKCHRS